MLESNITFYSDPVRLRNHSYADRIFLNFDRYATQVFLKGETIAHLPVPAISSVLLPTTLTADRVHSTVVSFSAELTVAISLDVKQLSTTPTLSAVMAPLLHVPEAPLVLNNECLKEISFAEPGHSKAVPLQREEAIGGLPVGSTTVQV